LAIFKNKVMQHLPFNPQISILTIFPKYELPIAGEMAWVEEHLLNKHKAEF
jgi:hypothetical protein